MISTNASELKLSNERAVLGEVDGIIHLLEEELKASPRHGIGLAAPQIGIHKCVAIIRTKDHSVDFVNPVIIDKKHGILVKGEACLSLPGISVDTWRFSEVLVRCDRNPAGLAATGLEAIAIQHEIDHLDGILITDRAAMRTTGRNEPCPCGRCTNDGKPIKYKRCHGR